MHCNLLLTVLIFIFYLAELFHHLIELVLESICENLVFHELQLDASHLLCTQKPNHLSVNIKFTM